MFLFASFKSLQIKKRKKTKDSKNKLIIFCKKTKKCVYLQNLRLVAVLKMSFLTHLWVTKNSKNGKFAVSNGLITFMI